MTNTVTVPVLCPASSDHNYDIVISPDVLPQLGDILRERVGMRRCLVITDNVVSGYYLETCKASLTKAGHQLLSDIIFTAGEEHKNFTTLQFILNNALAAGIDRKVIVIALGGGVVGDMAGFVASMLMRGVDFVQVPTTLLAQVDSAVGGKTAIDTVHGKNTVGAFHQPILVCSDISTLKTLSQRERRAGYAEIVKYGLINDLSFFGWCEQNAEQLLAGDETALSYAIAESCRKKAAIVEEDEKEAGIRALLNLGHTFGHALETHLGYNASMLLHGEAVAIGTLLAFRLSAMMGLCAVSDVERVERHFTAVGLPTNPPVSVTEKDVGRLIDIMATDKKADNGSLTLILTRGIGQCFVARNVDRNDVRAVWIDVLEK